MRQISDETFDMMQAVVKYARLFCETTMSEYEEIKDSDSAALPAEFVLLHRAVGELNMIEGYQNGN